MGDAGLDRDGNQSHGVATGPNQLECLKGRLGGSSSLFKGFLVGGGGLHGDLVVGGGLARTWV